MNYSRKIDIRNFSVDSMMENSIFYREYLAEKQEILKLKWIESEKAGRDIGYERAFLYWVREHRGKWYDARRANEPTHKK